jgi:hypothetical protein
MIAVRFLTAKLFRVLAPESATADIPDDFERRGGSALERDGALAYMSREGAERSMPLATKKLAFRKPGELCLVKTDEKAPDGRGIWLLITVEARV